MSRRALAAVVVGVGVSVVLYALLSGFIVAVATAGPTVACWLYGGVGVGLVLAVVGLTCIDVSDPATKPVER